MVTWWDCEFADLEHPQQLSTSPFNRATHWKQVIYYTKHNLSVQRDDILYGSIAVRKSKSNFRELDIKISYHIDNDINKKDFVCLYKLR